MGAIRSVILFFSVFIAAKTLIDQLRPEVLLVGNVTIDIIHGNRTLGGAISNAAALLQALGKRACVVTTAGLDADLSIFENHDLRVVPDNSTLTFAHTYTWFGHKRVLHVTERPSITLGLEHLPFRCRFAKTVFLMPLVPEDVDTPSFITWKNQLRWVMPQRIGLCAQGYQRLTDSHGKVYPLDRPHPKLMESLGDGVSVFLSDVESDSWSNEDIMSVISSTERLIITRGEKGADEIIGLAVRSIEAIKVDKVVDTNGAGDTFATAYMISLTSNGADPLMDASNAAARIVTKPQASSRNPILHLVGLQSCKPWCVSSDDYFLDLFQSSARSQSWSEIAQKWIGLIDFKWFASGVLDKSRDAQNKEL